MGSDIVSLRPTKKDFGSFVSMWCVTVKKLNDLSLTSNVYWPNILLIRRSTIRKSRGLTLLYSSIKSVLVQYDFGRSVCSVFKLQKYVTSD